MEEKPMGLSEDTEIERVEEPLPDTGRIVFSDEDDAFDDLTPENAEDVPAPAVQPERETPFSRRVFDFFELLIYAFAAVLLVFLFFLRVTVVDGPSMRTTLENGERLIISDFFYKPKAGDIVVFHPLPQENADGSLVRLYNEPLIKRVIATGGQVVDIDFDTWTVTVDGKVIDESAYRYLDPDYPLLTSDRTFPITVPEGYVFVMGDNRNNSTDSRSSRVGLVDERSIIGRVLWRLTPSRFGKVN